MSANTDTRPRSYSQSYSQNKNYKKKKSRSGSVDSVSAPGSAANPANPATARSDPLTQRKSATWLPFSPVMDGQKLSSSVSFSSIFNDGGSTSKSNSAPSTHLSTSTATTSAARSLMELLLHVRDKQGRGILHHCSHSDSSYQKNHKQNQNQHQHLLTFSHLLLQRAHSVGLDESFLHQRCLESGYTPLHTAIYKAHLSTLLLLLLLSKSPNEQQLTQTRYPNPNLTQTKRPIDLLMACNSHHQRDAEGLTPFQLLSRLQVPHLNTIRLALLQLQQTKNMQGSSASARPSLHQNDDDDDDDQNDWDFHSHDVTNYNYNHPSFACHVMTFGAAHHAALGVSDTTKNARHETNRPQRVDLPEPAIQVAAATHHSLFLTRSGHVYACGLGKGGRLGIDANHVTTSIPQRIQAFKHLTVMAIAAAENHSLAVTKENGHVYAWGSNRFGQLGFSHPQVTMKSVPTRVTDIKEPCVSVAAGERHSVALTRLPAGKVYTWGDNAAGQLGRLGTHEKAHLVSLDKTAIQIEASAQSTLVLVQVPNQFPAVYSWGHGNSVPIKVNFKQKTPSTDKGASATSSSSFLSYPVDIACAKHHNAAVTRDGTVYTWGCSDSTLIVATPTPQQDFHAVQVSACNHYTAVVTQEGHLYTWGATNSPDILGHSHQKWQRLPKRVVGIHAAVRVAVAKEHSVLLVGTTIPPLPINLTTGRCGDESPSSLTELAARHVCRHVDLFNVIPLLITAERCHVDPLREYCIAFVQNNLDAVLNVARKSDLETYLKEQLMANQCKSKNEDDEWIKDSALVHPLLYQILQPNLLNESEWFKSCPAVWNHQIPMAAMVKYRAHSTKTAFVQQGYCSEKCLQTISSVMNDEGTNTTALQIQTNYNIISKQVRSLEKRLSQVTKLLSYSTCDHTQEERDKIRQRPLWQADLQVLRPALHRAEKLMTERNMTLTFHNKDSDSNNKNHNAATNRSRTISMDPVIDTITDPGYKSSLESMKPSKSLTSQEVDKEEMKQGNDDNTIDNSKTVHYCRVCKVTCPDTHHLELHYNGRKHRNRIKQVEEEERRKTAAAILHENQQAAMAALSAQKHEEQKTTPKKTAWKKVSSSPSIEPRYKLSPPPIAPGPSVVVVNATANASSVVTTATTWPSPSMSASPKPSAPTQKALTSSAAFPSLLDPGVLPPLKNVPWANAPRVVKVTEGGKTKKKQSLQEFLHGPASSPSVVKPSTAPAAPWSSSPQSASKSEIRTASAITESRSNSADAIPGTAAVARRTKSFLEIQLEEENYIKHHQAATSAVSKDGKWFLGRAQRADSFSAIQQAEEEMKVLIAEQLAIEEQIARERQQRQEEEEQKKKHPGTKGKKKNGKNNNHSKKSKMTPDKKASENNKTPDKKPRNRSKGNKPSNASTTTVAAAAAAAS